MASSNGASGIAGRLSKFLGFGSANATVEPLASPSANLAPRALDTTAPPKRTWRFSASIDKTPARTDSVEATMKDFVWE